MQWNQGIFVVESLITLWCCLLLFAYHCSAELCPPFFGDFECPSEYECNFGVCKNKEGEQPLSDCSKITCRSNSRCHSNGKCIPIEGTPCGRNVLVGENMAYSIVSDCGRKGKCVNGKCVIDKCMEMLCEEGEHCRDGKCLKVTGNLCFSDFDCGSSKSGLYCKANKCERRMSTEEVFKRDFKLRCDPGESPQNEKCIPQDECAQLVCELGETCLNGFCIPTTFECDNISQPSPSNNKDSFPVPPCPDQMICSKNRVCVKDPCLDRCPPEHACINGGECRLLQGMQCTEECPPPFECLNGVCVKDECRRKVCQVGERCEGGFCVRIQGRLCKNSERDCGDAFECEKSECKDRIMTMVGNSTS